MQPAATPMPANPTRLLRVVATLIALVAGLGLSACSGPPPNPLLQTPALAVESLTPMLSAGPVFATSPAADPLRTAGAQVPPPARVRAAIQSAASFKELDREQRFALAVLAGPPAAYRPLLEHLIKAEDWTLVYVDHLCLAFARGKPQPWSLENTEHTAERLPGLDRARFLAGAGHLLLEAERNTEARRCLVEALKLDSGDPAARSSLAAVDAREGRWDAALKSADAVLQQVPGYPAALYVRGQALFALGRHDESLAIADSLLRRHPSDPQYLLLHAKAASRTGDREGEIASLRKLIAQMQAQGVPPGGYRVYLGQALSARLDSEGARREFELALEEGGLNPGQADFARKALDRFRDPRGIQGAAPPSPRRNPGKE
jgi:tetratricopeptide (TPR) repeat protein